MLPPEANRTQALTFQLVPRIDEALKGDVIKWAAFYEHRIRQGSKVIFHLEAFVAKFMRILERYIPGIHVWYVLTLTAYSYLMGMDF